MEYGDDDLSERRRGSMNLDEAGTEPQGQGDDDGSTETTSKVNPLLLRPVIEVVMGNMTVHDLRICRQVCTEWAVVGQAELQNSACLYLGFPEHIPKFVDSAEEIWVQHIHIDDGTNWREMNGLKERTLLESLWSSFVSKFQNADMMKSLVVPWSFWRPRFKTVELLPALLSRAEGLEELHLCYNVEKELIPVYVRDLIRSFPQVQLPSLKFLNIIYPSLHDKEFSRACIHGLLKAAAPTLEYLSMQLGYTDQVGDHHESQGVIDAKNINMSFGPIGAGLPIFPSLKTLRLGYDQSEFVYDQIVQRCPKLEVLDIFVTTESLDTSLLPNNLCLPSLKKFYFGHPTHDEEFVRNFLQIHLEGAEETLEEWYLYPRPLDD